MHLCFVAESPLPGSDVNQHKAGLPDNAEVVLVISLTTLTS